MSETKNNNEEYFRYNNFRNGFYCWERNNSNGLLSKIIHYLDYLPCCSNGHCFNRNFALKNKYYLLEITNMKNFFTKDEINQISILINKDPNSFLKRKSSFSAYFSSFFFLDHEQILDYFVYWKERHGNDSYDRNVMNKFLNGLVEIERKRHRKTFFSIPLPKELLNIIDSFLNSEVPLPKNYKVELEQQ